MEKARPHPALSPEERGPFAVLNVLDRLHFGWLSSTEKPESTTLATAATSHPPRGRGKGEGERNFLPNKYSLCPKSHHSGTSYR